MSPEGGSAVGRKQTFSLRILKIAFLAIAVIGIFSASALPIKQAQAQCETGYTPQGALCIPDTKVTGGFASQTTIGGFLLLVVKDLLILSAVVAILFIIIGGFTYMTSSGNQESADKGKKMVTNAIIGLVIIVLSYTIITVVLNTITTGNVLGTGGGTSGGDPHGCNPPQTNWNPSNNRCE